MRIKYIVLPGFNTSKEDYEGTVNILKELGVKKIFLSRDNLHPLNIFEERRLLFEIAKFKNYLAANGIEGVLWHAALSYEDMDTVELFCRQMGS